LRRVEQIVLRFMWCEGSDRSNHRCIFGYSEFTANRTSITDVFETRSIYSARNKPDPSGIHARTFQDPLHAGGYGEYRVYALLVLERSNRSTSHGKVHATAHHAQRAHRECNAREQHGAVRVRRMRVHNMVVSASYHTAQSKRRRQIYATMKTDGVHMKSGTTSTFRDCTARRRRKFHDVTALSQPLHQELTLRFTATP